MAVQGTASATIANGASLSGAIELGNSRPVAVLMPAGWATAVMTFQVSHDGVTYYDACDSAGAEVSVTSPAANKAISFNRNTMSAIMAAKFLKIRSGTSAASVNQGAERQLIVVAIP